MKDINHVDPQFVQYLWKRYSSISEEERAERRYQRLLNGPTRFAPQPKCDEKNLEEARKLLGITVRDKHKNSSVTKDDSYIVPKNDNARVVNSEDLEQNKRLCQTKKKEDVS